MAVFIKKTTIFLYIMLLYYRNLVFQGIMKRSPENFVLD